MHAGRRGRGGAWAQFTAEEQAKRKSRLQVGQLALRAGLGATDVTQPYLPRVARLPAAPVLGCARPVCAAPRLVCQSLTCRPCATSPPTPHPPPRPPDAGRTAPETTATRRPACSAASAAACCAATAAPRPTTCAASTRPARASQRATGCAPSAPSAPGVSRLRTRGRGRLGLDGPWLACAPRVMVAIGFDYAAIACLSSAVHCVASVLANAPAMSHVPRPAC